MPALASASPFQFEQLLTMRELAVYLKKSNGNEARRWAKRHIYSKLKRVGGQWRIDKRDVDEELVRAARVVWKGR